MENENINPWLHLWIHPRRTLRSILETDPKRVILWLAIVGGIFSGFSLSANNGYTLTHLSHLLLIIPLLIIIGAIGGVIHLYFSGWLLTVTGSWLGGKGSFTQVKCAVGWSNYPFIVAAIFSIASAYLLQHIWIKAAVDLVNLVIIIWGIVIYLKLIGEAHQFSSWRALIALFIAVILVFVALSIVALLVPLLAPLFR